MDLKLEGHQEVSNLYKGIKNTQSSQITLRLFFVIYEHYDW